MIILYLETVGGIKLQYPCQDYCHRQVLHRAQCQFNLFTIKSAGLPLCRGYRQISLFHWLFIGKTGTRICFHITGVNLNNLLQFSR